MPPSARILGSMLVGAVAALTLARAESPPAAKGCSQLRDWAARGTGTGFKLVDLMMGKWHQAWTHPLVHVSCTVEAAADGGFRIEGYLQPPPGESMDVIRGVWTRQADGSIHEELMHLDRETGRWEVFYSGFSRGGANVALPASPGQLR